MTQQHKLVSDVLLRCILQILDAPPENVIFIDRFLLALISHCARDQDVSRAIKDVETACSFLSQSEFELPKTPTMACLTILWKVGDRHFQMKKWSEAAEWFLVGTHKAFASVAQMSGPKSLRKAALCYIEQREYARASQVIRRCPDDQSSTFYLRFLAAAYQGLEDDGAYVLRSNPNGEHLEENFTSFTLRAQLLRLSRIWPVPRTLIRRCCFLQHNCRMNPT